MNHAQEAGGAMKKNTYRFWALAFIIFGFLSQPSFAFADTQVSQLQAHHRGGQTFLTWTEVLPNPLPESLSVPQLKKLKTQLMKDQGIQYFVYRSTRPISSFEGLMPIATVEPLSGWNADYYGVYPKDNQEAFRYVIEGGLPPLKSGIGLYVHTPKESGRAYYAVTVVMNGNENKVITSQNALSEPVQEENGQGVGAPVLQRVANPPQFQYIQGATLHYYVRWEAPPNSNVSGKAFDYLVAIPSRLVTPAAVGIHLHAWGGSLNRDYGWWYNAEKGAILLATNQVPYDWWTGYHEKLNIDQLKSPVDWQTGVVRPFTQRRLLSFLDWVSTQWKVDSSRTFVAGNSMGGSGSLMLAIRFPERIAWALSWVGIHIPAMSPQFKNSYMNIYGNPEWNVKVEDGTPVWDYFNDVWYLKQYPKKEIGFLTFSNGKNDGAIGWSQAVEFYQALQETKRPHMFVWGQHGHGERAGMPMRWTSHMAGQGRNMPIDIRTDQSLPAFTRSSFDDKPGNGDPDNGDPSGQVNAHLFWLTEDIVDTSERWEMTVGVGPDAPAEKGTVDVTPRRCQQFHPQSGEKFSWKNEHAKNGEVVQSGEVIADEWGLVTLKGIVISKDLNRLTIY